MRVFIGDLEFKYSRGNDREGNRYATLSGKVGEYNVTITPRLEKPSESKDTVR